MVGPMLMKSSISFILKTISTGAVMMLLVLPLTVCREGGEQVNSVGQPTTLQRETPRSAYDFVNSIGLNTHLNYFDRIYGNFPLVQFELRSIGIHHLRDGAHLQDAGYNTVLYGRWIDLGQSGIRFDAVLDPRSNLGPITSALLNQIDTLAGGTIESFEGPNEFDVSNVPDWPTVDRSFQSSVFQSVTGMQQRGSLGVIGPSMAFASHSVEVGDLSRYLNDGNLHPYPAGQVPSVVFPDQPNLARALSDNKPIIITETGYHDALNDHSDQPGISEAAAARYVPRLFLEDFAHGMPRTYLYEFMDEAPDPGLTKEQLHWGLVRADGTEKPAFNALKNLIQELNDGAQPSSLQPFAWSLSSQDPQLHHLLLQKSGGDVDLILWHEVPSFNLKDQTDITSPAVAAVLSLGRFARNITEYEPSLQVQPLHTHSNVNQVSLEIPDHPLVIEMSFQ